jgi:hypothetical protein
MSIPISRHGVRDNHAQSKATTAAPGRVIMKLPPMTMMIAAIPMGPKPRNCFAIALSEMGAIGESRRDC